MGGYVLGIDVGMSRIGAATARVLSDGDIVASSFALGRNGDGAPSVVFFDDHGALFGDAAERRGLTRPERLVRGFTRRVGDETPIIVGGASHRAEDLFAGTVAWVLGRVREREGTAPAEVHVTVPATWGPHRRRLLDDALERAGVPGAVLVNAPEAAGMHYEAAAPLRAGRAIAVYDLGGGSLDVAILRKDAAGALGVVGTPAGLTDFGGVDLDDAVLRHIVAAAGVDTTDSSEQTRLALAALRRECVEAKEALSFDTETVVPVLLGRRARSVRLTRSELESMVEPEVARTLEVVAQSLADANLTGADLDAIVLAGGTSRIPRVAQLMSERFDCLIAVDTDPKAIVALGAARAGARARGAVPSTHFPGPDPVPIESAHTAGSRSWFRRMMPRTAIGAAALVLGAGIVAVNAGGLGSAAMPSTWAAGDVFPWPAIAAAAGERDDAVVATPPAADSGDEWTSPRQDPSNDSPAKERKAPPTQSRPSPEPLPSGHQPAGTSGTGGAAGGGSTGSGSTDGTSNTDPPAGSTETPASTNTPETPSGPDGGTAPGDTGTPQDPQEPPTTEPSPTGEDPSPDPTPEEQTPGPTSDPTEPADPTTPAEPETTQDTVA
jgi:actin-like ATPase involved in cell morphogenesis